MHKGHAYCIDVASQMCDLLIVILFINGDDELRVKSDDKMLSVQSRIEQVKHICILYDNVVFHVIDVKDCKKDDGSEDWDAETPLVRKYVPKMDYVFSSEPSYEKYFDRAYPEAKHVIIDAERKTYPISSTMIRSMKLLEDRKKWII